MNFYLIVNNLLSSMDAETAEKVIILTPVRNQTTQGKMDKV